MTTVDSVKLICDQISRILNQLTDEQYSLSLDIFNGSSVGMHIRHIFDFYNCIIDGCNQQTIDYNCRERNPSIENDRSASLGAFSQLVSLANEVSDEIPLNIVTDFSIDENESRPVVSSSIGRELMYAYDHAVHHLAIIKMGVRAAFPEIKLEDHIGVAPSTVKYQSRN